MFLLSLYDILELIYEVEYRSKNIIFKREKVPSLSNRGRKCGYGNISPCFPVKTGERKKKRRKRKIFAFESPKEDSKASG